MMFLNIHIFLLKITDHFKEPFYNLLSTVECKDNSLSNLKGTYIFFTQKTQEYSKIKRQAFLKMPKKEILHLNDDLKLKSICLVNKNNKKIIKEWNFSRTEKFISLYNKEIQESIESNLTNDGDKVQIKIKINGKIPEFIFWEFIVSGEYVEFGNCRFFTQKECYLDYFPMEIRSIDFLLYYRAFLLFIISLPLEQYKAKTASEKQYIKSATIKIKSFPCQFFFDTKDFEKKNKFEFTDFNFSIKQNESFEEDIKTPEMDIRIKPQTLFFEPTKKISNISLDLFVSIINPEDEQIESTRIFLDISNDGKITREVETNNFSLVEIQKEKNSIKIILCRPTGNTENSINVIDSLSIEFLDLMTNIKSTNITLGAKESIKGNFVFTTFTIKKGELKGKNSNLYDVIRKAGLVSITLNGRDGMIGTYVFCVSEFKLNNCIYSDKLINIPLGTNEKSLQEKLKSGFFTKKFIIFVVVIGLIICVSIFVYFYTQKEEEEVFDTF